MPTHYYSASSKKSKKATATETDGAAYATSDRMANGIENTEDHLTLGGSPPIKFASVEDLLNKVECRRAEIDKKNCYLVFDHVGFSQHKQVVDYRDENRMHFRFAYFLETRTLIIKIPSAEHEEAHANFSMMIIEEDIEHWLQNSKTHKTQQGSALYSAKEGDSSWTNRITRPRADSWPVFMIEAGNSESLAHLIRDAKWWLESSDGQVRMVILIKVNKTDHTIQILKYIPIPHPATYSLRSQPTVMPSLDADVLVNISTIPPQVQGGPLTLEFDRLFDRPPNSLAENDITLSNQSLGDWAVSVLT